MPQETPALSFRKSTAVDGIEKNETTLVVLCSIQVAARLRAEKHSE